MPLMTWATHVLQWWQQRGAKSQGGADLKKAISVRIVELLVIADQNAAVNTFPGLVHTARHTMGVGSTRSQCGNRKRGQLPKVRLMTGVKS